MTHRPGLKDESRYATGNQYVTNKDFPVEIVGATLAGDVLLMAEGKGRFMMSQKDVVEVGFTPKRVSSVRPIWAPDYDTPSEISWDVRFKFCLSERQRLLCRLWPGGIFALGGALMSAVFLGLGVLSTAARIFLVCLPPALLALALLTRPSKRFTRSWPTALNKKVAAFNQALAARNGLTGVMERAGVDRLELEAAEWQRMRNGITAEIDDHIKKVRAAIEQQKNLKAWSELEKGLEEVIDGRSRQTQDYSILVAAAQAKEELKKGP